MEGGGRFRFNAYDVFSHFLPGVLLFFGLTLPFLGEEQPFPDLNLIAAVFAAVVAYGLGLGTQALGSIASRRKVFGKKPWSKRNRPFNYKMNKMLEIETKESEFSNIDWAARELCVEVFDLDCDGSDNTEHLFKSLLAYLEASQWNRSLRIQALHLASRGLYVVSLILLMYYGVFGIGLSLPSEFSVFMYDGYLNAGHFFILSVLMIPTSWILFDRARHYESDVVIYILSEFFMSQYNWEDLDVSELEGVDLPGE